MNYRRRSVYPSIRVHEPIQDERTYSRPLRADAPETASCGALWEAAGAVASPLPYVRYGTERGRYAAPRRECPGSKAGESGIVFISHRSEDKAVADMLADFFAGTGIPRSAVFCSSLPGSDVGERVSGEVKAALKNSVVNIAILSWAYFESSYCLNEAGILWYQDNVPVIPIALPEVGPDNLRGFLGSEYKLRSLCSDTDISYIYDTVSRQVHAPHTGTGVFMRENSKLRERYADFLKKRVQRPVSVPEAASNAPPVPALPQDAAVPAFTTDDEQIVLYYILRYQIRRVSKREVREWLHQNEIYGVNVDNAFDLLSFTEGVAIDGDYLSLSLETFRRYAANTAALLQPLKTCMERHTRLASDTFRFLWERGSLNPATELFAAYISDERMCSFGSRWASERQLTSIREWENKHELLPLLSRNYGGCLELFIQNSLVYEDGETNRDAPQSYLLCPSLQSLLFSCPTRLAGELNRVRESQRCPGGTAGRAPVC